MNQPFRSVLITGTTSGLGKAFQDHYVSKGVEVLAVNRRPISLSTPGVLDYVVDITDAKAVRDLVRSLKASEKLPGCWILNAGINRPDNVEGFNAREFESVMRTNLLGVLTFVGAIQECQIQGARICALSSTSNLIPNPGHVAYFLSKKALFEGFSLLQKNDPLNDYKTVVLGPVSTNIMRGYPKPTGLQGKIFDALAVEPRAAAEACAGFFASSRKAFRFPWKAWLFYRLVSWLLILLPGFYLGTRKKSAPLQPIAD